MSTHSKTAFRGASLALLVLVATSAAHGPPLEWRIAGSIKGHCGTLEWRARALALRAWRRAFRTSGVFWRSSGVRGLTPSRFALLPGHTAIAAHTHRDNRTAVVISNPPLVVRLWQGQHQRQAQGAAPGTTNPSPAVRPISPGPAIRPSVVYITGIGPTDTAYITTIARSRSNVVSRHAIPTNATRRTIAMTSYSSVRDPLADNLLTPQNAAVLIIDFQPVEVPSMASRDRRQLVADVTALSRIPTSSPARCARDGQLPTGRNRPTIHQIIDVPDVPPHRPHLDECLEDRDS